jgi:translation elongation factor EF-Tu-like GTPase
MDAAIVVVLAGNGGCNQPEEHVLGLQLEDSYNNRKLIDSLLSTISK